MDTGRCRSCRSPVVWATTANDKSMPVDPRPHAEGNCRLHDGDVVVLSGEQLAAARAAGERLHLSHFATCTSVRARRARDRNVNTATGRTVTQESLL